VSAAVDDRVGDFEAFFCADKYFVQVALAYGGDTLTRIASEELALPLSK